MPTYMSEGFLTQAISVKLTTQQRQWLEAEARRQKRPMNQVFRALIDKAMAQEESRANTR